MRHGPLGAAARLRAPEKHMRCTRVRIGGAWAIICGKHRIAACVKCGCIATRECDWKLGRDRTCDAALCDSCTASPAPGKDLCPEHAEAWASHPW